MARHKNRTAAARKRTAAARTATVATILAGALASSFSVAQAAPAQASFPHYDHARHSNQIWGGYVDTGRTYNSVSAQWAVPSLDCAATPDSSVSPWVGLDGVGSSSIEQIGFDQDCSGGTASYHPWVEMYPAGSNYFTETIQAGDTIKASVNATGTSYTLTETDTTQGWSKTFHETGNYKRASAEVILEDLVDDNQTTIPSVADFGHITFTKATANGQPLASAGTPQSMDIERGNTPLTHNSTLSGNRFTINWGQS
jgi:hypothetical protein